MKWKHYLMLCLLLSVLTAGSVLWVPGLSEDIEASLIGFLSSNAR